MRKTVQRVTGIVGNIKNLYRVLPVPASECKEWLLYRHYAHRLCPISYSYGLFDLNGKMMGCCVFGGSANRNNARLGRFKIIELNRLVVTEGLEKNVLSYFVSYCLRSLPSPICVISYADPQQGHHGYIYQATNWIYLGQGQRKDGGWDSGVTAFIKDGKPMHAKTVSSLIGSASKSVAEEHGFERVFTKPKHKYIYFLGNKREIKEMMQVLPYKPVPYPKGDNCRYDIPDNNLSSLILF